MIKTKEPAFVIQEHRATHLHYDFRLEMDGVLKSWAIPKEPSMDPKVKRLAIRVEDHKLGYENFEGVIPEGMYGAGPVKIWDKGSYELKARTGDKIIFNLNGKKLKGEFFLVKFKKAGPKSWLFFKTSKKID